VSSFAPFVEEVLFRLNLRSNHFRFSAMIGVLVMISIPKFFNEHLSDFSSVSFVAIGCGVSVILALTWTLRPYKLQIEKFVERNFRILFFILTIAFGFIHVFNYEPGTANALVLAVMIIPQITTGFFLGFIRMRFGFFWSFYFMPCSIQYF
jgi:hypothetical protein